MSRSQLARRAGDDEQFRNQFRAFGTISEMSLLFGAAAVFVFYQAVLQLNASHTTLPKPLLPQSTATSKLALSVPRPLSVFAGFVYYFVACRGASGFLSFPTFFCPLHFEQIAQFHARFVQLGLAVPDRATDYLGYLIMFVTFDVVKNKNRPVTGREVIHCLLQLQPVNGSG